MMSVHSCNDECKIIWHLNCGMKAFREDKLNRSRIGIALILKALAFNIIVEPGLRKHIL